MNLWKIIENKFFSARSLFCAVRVEEEKGNIHFSHRHQQQNIAERKLHNSANAIHFLYADIHVYVE